MGWMGSGYDKPDEPEVKFVRRWRVPQGETKRALFLSNVPQTAFVHGFKNGQGFWDSHICMHKNKIADHCPMCTKNRAEGKDSSVKWAQFTGHYMVINMTKFFFEKKERWYCYGREMFCAKHGSEKNPGVLRKLEKLAERHGGLAGCIFDIERERELEESCGSTFHFVEKVKDIDALAQEHLTKWCEFVNEEEERDDDKLLTVEKMLEYNPWEDCDISELLEPLPMSKLEEMFKVSGGIRRRSRDDDDEGGSRRKHRGRGDDEEGSSRRKRKSQDDDYGSDDDIPY